MALIYNKASPEKALILATRQSLQRPFDLGAWTELRLAMFFSATTSGSDNTHPAQEILAHSTVADHFHFGLKDSGTTTMPGIAGAQYWGTTVETSGTAQTALYTPSFLVITMGNQPTRMNFGGYDGTTRYGGGVGGVDSGSPPGFPANMAAATNYCGIYCMQFVLTNRGLATQQIHVSANGNSVTGSYSQDALFSALVGRGFGGTTQFAWNDGVTAKPIPDSVFIHAPFTTARLRIHTLCLIRIS